MTPFNDPPNRRGYLHTLRDRRCQELPADRPRGARSPSVARTRSARVGSQRAWPSSEFVGNIAASIRGSPSSLSAPKFRCSWRRGCGVTLRSRTHGPGTCSPVLRSRHSHRARSLRPGGTGSVRGRLREQPQPDLRPLPARQRPHPPFQHDKISGATGAAAGQPLS